MPEIIDFQEPCPFRFNPWKHHLKWVIDHINILKADLSEIDNDVVVGKMKSINSNQIDIYTGSLSPGEIVRQIGFCLSEQNISDQEIFSQWMADAEYQQVMVSDCSLWILRQGLNDNRYIHIHPARNSPNSVRIHGNSWKTAVVMKRYFGDSRIDLALLNAIRQNYLNLSPVKSLQKRERIWKALHLLTNGNSS